LPCGRFRCGLYFDTLHAMDFEQLLKTDKYQVFLFVCPATMPFSFGCHPWSVVNKSGTVSRWKVFWRPQEWETRWGHLHKNFYAQQQGITKYFFSDKYLWGSSKLLGYIEGGVGSLANQMSDFIESSPQSYPYCYTYSLSVPTATLM